MISIIIPIYNADKDYLEKCLKSALSQTDKDIEVIAVNDGSVNGCEEVIKRFETDKRLRYIYQENAGTSVARNTGLDAASGEYVLFLDADDYLEADCCEKTAAFMKEKRSDIVFFGYATEYINRQVKRVLEEIGEDFWQRDTLELAVLRGDRRLGPVEIGSPWGKLIKKSVITENGVRYTPGLIKGQDTVFILDLIEKCSCFAYFSYLGYHYRISEKSVSHRYNPKIVEIMEKTLEAYAKFTAENGKDERFGEAVRRKYYRVLTGEYLELLYINKGNPAPKAERMAQYSELLKKEVYAKATEAIGDKGDGLFDTMMLKAVKKGDIARIFALKKAETALKRLVIKQYG